MEEILLVEGIVAAEIIPEIVMKEVLEYAGKLRTEESSDNVNTGKYISNIVEELKKTFGEIFFEKRSNKLMIIKHIISWGQADSKEGDTETSSSAEVIGGEVKEESNPTVGGIETSTAKVDEEEVKEISGDIPTSWSRRFGSVVWSKMSKTSPWWPSFVCDPSLLDSNQPVQIQALKESEKKYLVFYYGESPENSYGFVKESQIEDYLDHRDEYETQSLETKKKTLIKALPLADSEAVLPVESRKIWVDFLRDVSQFNDKKEKSRSNVYKKRDSKSLDDDEEVGDEVILEKKIRGPYKKKIKDGEAEMTMVGEAEITVECEDQEVDSDYEEKKEGQIKPEKRCRPSGLTYKKRVMTSSIDESGASAVELNDMSKKKRGRPSLQTLDQSGESGDLEGEETMCFDTSSVNMENSSIKELPKKAKKGYIYLDKQKGEKQDKEYSLMEARASTSSSSSGEMSNIEDVQVSKGRGRPSKHRNEDYISPYLQAKAAREELQKQNKAENDNSAAVITKRSSKRSRTTDEEERSNDDSPHINTIAGDNEFKDYSIEDISEVIENEGSVKKEMVVEAAGEEGTEEEYEGRRLHDKAEKEEEEENEEEAEDESEEEEEEEEEVIKSTGRRASSRIKDDDDDYDYTQISEIKKNDGRGRKKGSLNKAKSDTDPKGVKVIANLVKNKGKETKTRGRPRKEKNSDENLDIIKGSRILPKRLASHKILIQTSDEEVDEEEEEEEEAAEVKVETPAPAPASAPRAEESRLERSSRLLNILKINTKSTITNVEKALLTITKIDTLDLSVDELKETGTAEVIASLRKHSNPTLAARAKQLRAKWIEGVRGTQIAPVPSSALAVPLPSNPSIAVITSSATGYHPESTDITLDVHTNSDVNPNPNPLVSVSCPSTNDAKTDHNPLVSVPCPSTNDAKTDHNAVVSSSGPDSTNKANTNPNTYSVKVDDSQIEGKVVKDNIQVISPQMEGNTEDIDTSSIFSCIFSIPSSDDGENQRGLNYLLPESVKSSIVRSRSVKMLLCALKLVQDDDVIRTAIWLEDRIYETLCATAIQANNQVLPSVSSLTPATVGSGGGSGVGVGTSGGDATAISQGAGSAFNRYLATVTRLTFALQMEELSTLRNSVIHMIKMNKQDDKKEILSIYSILISSILAKNVLEILEVNVVIK